MSAPSTNPYAPPEAALGSDPEAERHLFFPVGAAKLVVMSLCTASLYEFYWFYRNFRCMQAHGRDIWPIPRALFFPITSFTLFRFIRERGVELPAGVLAVLVFIFNLSWRIPGSAGSLSALSFVPLLPVRNAIEQINRQAAPDADLNTRIRGWNYLAVVLGVLGWGSVIVGLVMGPAQGN